MFLEIIGIVISLISLIIGIINTIRMNRIKKEQIDISIMDLAEFQNLSKDVKDFYKVFILEKWIKNFNQKINSSIKVDGLDQFFIKNKDKLIKLNNLYLDIISMSVKNESLIDELYNVFIYNADLDKLIEEAEARKSILQALQ